MAAPLLLEDKAGLGWMMDGPQRGAWGAAVRNYILWLM